MSGKTPHHHLLNPELWSWRLTLLCFTAVTSRWNSSYPVWHLHQHHECWRTYCFRLRECNCLIQSPQGQASWLEPWLTVAAKGLISPVIFEQLNDRNPKTVRIKTFRATETQTTSCDVVELGVTTLREMEHYESHSTSCFLFICNSLNSQPNNQAKYLYNHCPLS